MQPTMFGLDDGLIEVAIFVWSRRFATVQRNCWLPALVVPVTHRPSPRAAGLWRHWPERARLGGRLGSRWGQTGSGGARESWRVAAEPADYGSDYRLAVPLAVYDRPTA